jgi:hypothetical protein
VLGAGTGQLVCAGRTPLDQHAPVLANNTATAVGLFRCVSADAGITCTNTYTRHGFFISAQSYRTF